MRADLSETRAEPRTPKRVRGSDEGAGRDRRDRTARSQTRPSYRRRRILLLAALLLAIAVIARDELAGTGLPDVVARSQVISEGTLEQDYGVRVDLVGVSAGGGLIDFRFTVLEPDKAAPLFESSSSSVPSPGAPAAHKRSIAPLLLAEESNTLVEARGSMAHHHIDLAAGKTYFILYPNPGGKIQAGAPVSVVLGGVRVQHVIAQS